jgi:membrane fusion protein (multidrug efflux system)
VHPAPKAEPAVETAAPARSGPPKVLIGVVVVGLGAGTAWYLHARHFEYTDDAQIDGTINAISPRIAGTLVAVNVQENQTVKAGDVLAEIDPTDYKVALEQAEAAVEQAEALVRAEDPSVTMTATSNETANRSATFDLDSSRAALSAARKEQSQLTASLAQAKANESLAKLELDRATKLYADQAVPKSDLDARQSAWTAASAAVRAATDALAAAQDRISQQESRVQTSEARLSEVKANGPLNVETRKASVIARQAALKLAQAQLEQAKLNLSYTKILAPAAGVIGHKGVSAGDRVAPGQQLMALSQLSDLWVTANYRETQLRDMRPGQRAEMHVDAANATLHGSVEAIGGATGSKFSILPPENATGNYVKVVQRIPVRIHLDPGQPGLERLRPGMSVEPSVRVR